MIRSASFAIVALVPVLALAACGGAAEAPPRSPAKTSAPADEREPTSIEEAEEQIARARAELAVPGEAAGGAAPGSAQPAAEPSSDAARPSAAPRTEGALGSGDACASSCRALSSMRRAVSALCRMTGDEDARCADARRTLGESESRVATCHCGA